MKGRPSKTTVDYFPHQTTHKKTIFTLESLYGNDGYAFWFKLLEILGSTEGHAFRYEKAPDWLFLVAKSGVTEEKAILILQTLADLEAIDSKLHKEKIVWCDNFIEGLLPVYDKRSTEIPSKPTLRGEKGLKGEKIPQSKVKKSKVEQSIETSLENKPDFIPVELWIPLMESRIQKKLALSPIALKRFCNSIKKGIDAGYTAEDCIGEYVSCSWDRFDHTWMKKDNGKEQSQRERHNDIREQYAKDLLATRYGDEFTGDRSNEKLGY